MSASDSPQRGSGISMLSGVGDAADRADALAVIALSAAVPTRVGNSSRPSACIGNVFRE